MCGLEVYKSAKRSVGGAFAPNEGQQKFRVWGSIDGEEFDRTFPSARAWRAWRSLQRAEVEVRGMCSEASQ